MILSFFLGKELVAGAGITIVSECACLLSQGGLSLGGLGQDMRREDGPCRPLRLLLLSYQDYHVLCLLIERETGPDFVPGLPRVVRIESETGPGIVPGLPRVMMGRDGGADTGTRLRTASGDDEQARGCTAKSAAVCVRVRACVRLRSSLEAIGCPTCSTPQRFNCRR